MKIIPSIISSNLTDFDGEVEKIERVKADRIHIDVYPLILWVLEYHALSRYTLGGLLIDSLKRRTSIPLDLHLMVEVDEEVLKRYLDAGLELITIPFEASYKPLSLIRMIRSGDVRAGLSVTPLTPLELIRPYLKEVDSILFLTNNVNYGGKIRYEETIARVKMFKEISAQEGFRGEVGVDGGITVETASRMLKAGVNTFYLGHSFFKNDGRELADSIRKMAEEDK